MTDFKSRAYELVHFVPSRDSNGDIYIRKLSSIIESELRETWNEALEEAADAADNYHCEMDYPISVADKIRALKKESNA